MQSVRSGRSRAVPRTALVVAAAFLLLLGAVLLPKTLQAQSVFSTTAAPTNVSATKGDKEALISWQLPEQVGSCYIRGFYVYVYDRYARGAGVDHVAGQSELIPRAGAAYSWFLDELKPNTAYRAHVYSHSETGKDTNEPCPGYSASSEYVNFTTNATNSGSDPTAPASNAKKRPLRPRDVSVSPTSAGATTATLTYKGARTNGGAKRCTIDDRRQLTAYRIFNADTGAELDGPNAVDDNNDRAGNVAVAYAVAADDVRTVNLTGLTSGTRYTVKVSAYSRSCDLWSKYRKFTWTQ